ncbi:hypothetical protein M404DRAFT_1003246 [Pisolithus tinctorius Marx 270]|uniref:Uncharacterized protein n=1 Tax=Pisolithus tinctorius Marx 270 TaxID=870435 RepID=A0A0C3JUR6_PISTI|nr:hypothetical protein M404DRAFT_1003246 [Pisolithus tinctorius Marx 270]
MLVYKTSPNVDPSFETETGEVPPLRSFHGYLSVNPSSCLSQREQQSEVRCTNGYSY